MSKNKILIIGAIILVLVIGAIIIFGGGKKISVAPSSPTPGVVTTETKKEVPQGAKVYEAGESAPEGIAAPISVSEMSGGNGIILRAFSITAEKDKFTPNTVIVYQNDIVKLFIKAVDKDYTIVQPDSGLIMVFKKGEDKYLEKQMFEGPGDYLFYCENCGGLNSTAVGHIIVLPRPEKEINK
ncbi:MAG: hypothetical protein ACPLKV_02395 [Minisyncoccia bacterium]